MGTAGPKPSGHKYTTPACILLWLLFLWGACCACQNRNTMFDWGPPAQGNFELETPNSAHGCIVTWCAKYFTNVSGRVHFARAVHVHNQAEGDGRGGGNSGSYLHYGPTILALRQLRKAGGHLVIIQESRELCSSQTWGRIRDK